MANLRASWVVISDAVSPFIQALNLLVNIPLRIPTFETPRTYIYICVHVDPDYGHVRSKRGRVNRAQPDENHER